MFENYENTPENIKASDWICRVGKLKELLEQQKSRIAFYFGAASNMGDIIPLFDKVVLLQVSKEVLEERLSKREGTDDIGGTQESREIVLGWKDWFEKDMKERGATAFNANGSINEVEEKIIGAVS